MADPLRFSELPPPSAMLGLFSLTAASPDIGKLALGLALPGALERVKAGRTQILWLGPREWLVALEDDSGAKTEPRWRDELGDDAVVVDMSDAWRRYRLEGAGWRIVLSGPLPFDLTVRPVGCCLRSVLQGVPVVLSIELDELHLWAPRGYAGALAERLSRLSRLEINH